MTLSRGENFHTNTDPARQRYNPAMIEVGGETEQGTVSSLILTHIILDDMGKYEGEYFVQADSEGDGETTVSRSEVPNTSIVQDAIIATYNGMGTITLGDGAELRNYGGMSAVRLSGGDLIMEEGSAILDTTENEREKGASGSFGPAGAVWLQGGILTMNGGTIGGDKGVMMNGRALYADGGTANIGGTIQNIHGTDAAWQGQNGVAVHLRSHGEATLASTGEITNVTGTNAGNNCAIWTQFCNFTTKAGSKISHVDGFQLLYFDDLDNNNYSHEVYLNGTISECASGSASLLRSWYGQITFGPNSVIENCSSSSAGGLIYSNNGSHYTFAGTIRNNTASKGMIYLANQGGGGVIATIEETAHIVDNKGLAVRVNNSSNLTMNGGEIARNSSYGIQISGKTDWTGVKFIMNGGKICDNGSYGIYHTVAGKSLVEINGGTISGNKGSSGRQISSSGGYAVAETEEGAGYEYTHVSADVMGEPRTIYVSAGKVELPEGYADVDLGRATNEAVNTLKAGVANEHADWIPVGSSALWVQPSATEYSFELDPTSSPKKTDLYVAYVQVNPDGSPIDGAEVAVEEVENAEKVPIALKDLTAGAPYAVMLFNNKEYTLAPDDITIYTGGGQGEENYDDGGFPKLTINGSVDVKYTGDITSLEIKGVTIPATDDKTMLDQLLENIEAVYTYEDGTVATDDSKPGVYTVALKWKNGLTNEDVRVNGNNVNLDGAGTLIVRHTQDIEEAQDGANTYSSPPSTLMDRCSKPSPQASEACPVTYSLSVSSSSGERAPATRHSATPQSRPFRSSAVKTTDRTFSFTASSSPYQCFADTAVDLGKLFIGEQAVLIYEAGADAEVLFRGQVPIGAASGVIVMALPQPGSTIAPLPCDKLNSVSAGVAGKHRAVKLRQMLIVLAQSICFQVWGLLDECHVLPDHTGNICDPASSHFCCRACSIIRSEADAAALGDLAQSAVVPFNWQETILHRLYGVTGFLESKFKFRKIGMLCVVHSDSVLSWA